jgi:hypothetical protein
MRKGLLLTCSLLLSLPASASVVLIRPAEVTLSTDRSVRSACYGVVETACTNFEDADLYCICAPKAGGWAPQVRITAQPHMYLSNIFYRVHEMGHIFDFENAMKGHAAEMETRAFTSRTACEEFLTQQRLHFPTVLRGYVRTSMWLRDRKVLPDRK